MSDELKNILKAGLLIVAIIAAIALPVWIGSFFVSVGGEPGMAGGCISISFDKWDMMRADKIVIEFRGGTYTVTDQDFVQAFCRGTLDATYTDYCCAHFQEGSVKIYRQDKLIRSMRYVENHDGFVYDADSTHWVLFGDEGHAFLSGETAKAFRHLIGLP